MHRGVARGTVSTIIYWQENSCISKQPIDTPFKMTDTLCNMSTSCARPLLTFEREMTHISLLDGFDIQSSGKPLQAERTDYTIRFNSVQETSLSLINLVTKLPW